MQVRVLGSGTSTGVPIIGCDCSVCSSSGERNKRTRASLLLSVGEKNIVIDTSPEFRLQILQAGIKTLSAVLYTHIHADHCHGFDDLRVFSFAKSRGTPISCYMDASFIEEFKNKFSYVFATNSYYGTLPQVELLPVPAGIFKVAGIEIESVRLPHGAIMTNAYRCGSFAYATDFKYFSDALLASWRGKIETMLISGARFKPHPTHSSVSESLAIMQTLGVRRGYLTHLSHDVDYYKHSDALPSGFAFAYDGLVIDL